MNAVNGRVESNPSPDVVARFQVAAARRMLYRHGCDSWNSGHVSMRSDDSSGSFWINPAQYFDETLPGDIVCLSFDMKMLEGEKRPSPTVGFHASIYKRRPDVNAIVHTHSDSAAIFSTLREPLGMYNISAVFFHESVRHYDYKNGLDESQGDSFAEALGTAKALVLPNHGVIVTSNSVQNAAVETMIFERCARIHLGAKQVGGCELSLQEVRSLREMLAHSHRQQIWRANMRRLRTSDPEIFESLPADIIEMA